MENSFKKSDIGTWFLKIDGHRDLEATDSMWHGRPLMGDWAKQSCMHFYNLLVNALTDPKWRFNGCGTGSEGWTGEEFIAFHKKRIKEETGRDVDFKVIEVFGPNGQFQRHESGRMREKFVWDDHSKSIRQMPYNYCVAVKEDNSFFNPGFMDSAIPENLAVEMFKVLRKHENRWGSVKNALEKLNALLD